MVFQSFTARKHFHPQESPYSFWRIFGGP